MGVFLWFCGQFGSLSCSFFLALVSLLHSLAPFFFHLEVDGFVWKSVVQLSCVPPASPGSDYGLFPLICCWKAVLLVGFSLWLSVTSFSSLWQPKLQVLLTKAYDALDCAVFLYETIVYSPPFFLRHYWKQYAGCLWDLSWFLFFFVLCSAILFVFFVFL